ncbi:hypothetical protein N801_09535 [Knoellia aerolata DSM 18566]|uniref:Uncharacterized protein n=1 Tax=Knoellia aerolata DSM 18566 TaxID=1385519 RepID=A0A0A0JZZ9_9MICO|nr:hypothetical protein N801_09535 [Knoellia aerolata DSM 18566]
MLVCRHYLDLTEQQSADLLQVSLRSVKEQTSRALATGVAGTLGPESVRQLVADLVVTESDVERLEVEIRERIDSGALGGPAERPRRRWALAAAAAATAAAVAGGLALSADDPAPTRPAPTPVSDQPLVPADLVGLWRNVPESPWLWEFTADGRMGATETSSGYLSGGTVAKTISRRDGDRYITSDPTEDCGTDYRVRLTSAGAVVTVLSGTCAEDWVGAEYDLERLSPGVAGPGAILPRHAKADAPTRMTTAQLDGTWFDPESSTVLVVGQGYSGVSLTYVMDDDGDGATDPDQRGLLAMEPDGSIRARPSAGNADVECGPQFTNVMTDSATMTTTGADGGCAPTGSQQTWIRVN